MDIVYASRSYIIQCQPGDENFQSNVTLSAIVELGSGRQPISNVSLFHTKKMYLHVEFPRNAITAWIRCSLHAGENTQLLNTIVQITGKSIRTNNSIPFLSDKSINYTVYVCHNESLLVLYFPLTFPILSVTVIIIIIITSYF